MASLMAAWQIGQPLQAATVYWDINGTGGAGASNTGSATGTWDGVNTFFNTDPAGGVGSVAAWSGGDTLVFSAGTNATNVSTVTVSGTQGIGGLTFEEGLVTLTGGALQLTANSDINVATGLTATVNSTLDGAFNLTKTGNGVLALGGTNSYSGNTLINAGTLSISSDANLGTAPGGVVADSINFTGSSTLQFTGTGNPTINSNRGITIGNTFTGTTQVVASANTVAYGGVITGAAGTTFRKTGSGTLNLSGNSTSAYLGALNVDGGTLALSGAGRIAGTSSVTIGNRATLTLDQTTNTADRIAGGITTTTGGTLNFTHAGAAATNYAENVGLLTLTAGALTINGSQAASGQTSAVTLSQITRSAGGTLYFNGTGAGTNNRNELLVTSLTGIPASGVIIPWAVVNDGTGVSFAQNTGAGTTLRRFAGTVLTTAPSNWVAASNARPAATGGINNANRSVNTITFDNGVNLDGTAATALSADRNITMSGAGGGAILQTGGTSSVTSNGSSSHVFVFGGNEALFHILGTLDIGTGATADTNLTGTGGLTKTGAGTLIIRGNSTITGTTRVNEGILEGRLAASFGAAQPLHLNGGTLRLSADAATTFTPTITVNADSTIQVDRVTAAATATTHQVGTLTIGGGRVLSVNSNDITSGTAYGLTAGALTLTSGGATIDVANNGAGIGTMIVTSVAGAFPLIKTGAGDFLNNSVAGGYTAPVEIQAGRLGWGGSTGTVTESQTFSGAGGLIKSGVVVVNLTGANTFTGEVRVTNGTLGFSTVSDNGGTASNLGQGTDGISMGGGTLSFIGGISQSTNRAVSFTAASTLSANGTSGASITYATAVNAGANNWTLGGTAGSAGFLTNGIASTGATDATINGGTWTLTGTSTLGDDLTVTGAGTILNLNNVNALTFNAGASADATLQIQAGATVNIGVTDAVTAADFDRLLVGQGGAAATSVLNLGAFNLTTGRFDVGGTAPGLIGNVNGSGTLTVTADFNFLNGVINANLATAAANIDKNASLDTVTLRGDNSGLVGGGTFILAGGLTLDYTASNTTKLNAAGALDMRGGTLTMTGNAAATTQTVASLTLGSGGANKIDVNAGAGGAVLNINAITRAVLANDGTMRFELPTGTQSVTNGITTDALNNNTTTHGILGGWATVDTGSGVFFARNTTNAADGNIVAATTTTQDALGSWTAGINVTDSAGYSGTLADCMSINSLRFDANAASAVTIPVGGVLNIATGGILMTSNAATGVHTISGGVLNSGIGELIFTQDSVAQGLTVSSIITAASGVTKTGNGTLTLSGSNNYTGITDLQAGTLVAAGTGIGDRSAVTLADDRASTLQITGNETIGVLAGGNLVSAIGVSLGVVDLGSNTLTINQSVSSTYAGTFTGNGTIVMNAGNTGNLNINNVSTGFTGAVVVNGGLFQIGGAGRIDATSFTVNKGGNLLVDANDVAGVTEIATRILDTTPITLNSADGAFSGQTIVRGLATRVNQNFSSVETVGTLTFGSGASYLSGEASGTIGIAIIQANDFVRSNNATVSARGRVLGTGANDRNQFRIGTALNQTAFIGTLVGGGGAAGTQNISIVPWGIGETTAGALADTNMGNSLITYVSGAGFRPLDLVTEYDTIALAAATDNARASLTADLTGLVGTTVNALVLHNADAAGNTTRLVTGTGAGQTLAITSGALLFTRDTGAAGNYGVTLGGFNSGITTAGVNPEYVIHVVNPDSASATKTLTATISSNLTSTADITKSGRGILVLSGTNTAGGNTKKTTINEGTLQIGDLDSIGGNTGGLVFAGGTLQLGSAFDTTTDDLSTRTISFLNGGGTLDTNGKNPIFAATLGTGSGTFTKAGAGNLTLNAATTLTGATVISAGEITIGANNAIGSGNLTIAGGATLTLGANSIAVGNITTAATSVISASVGSAIAASGDVILAQNTSTFNPTLSGAMNLIKQTASQTITLASATSSYTGYTWIQDGTILVSSIANSGTNSTLGAATGDNSAIRLGNAATVGALNITGAAMSTDRNIWLMGTTGGGTIDKDGTGALTMNSSVMGVGIGAKTLTLQGTAGTIALPNTLEEICELSSVLSLTKAESGVWYLPNANSYTGTTTLTLGTLVIGDDGSVGTGLISFGGGVLDNANENRTLANNVSMGGTGTLQGTGDFNFTGSLSQTGGSRQLNINNVGTTTFGDSAADTFVLADANQARTLTLVVAATSPTIINATIQDGTGTGTDNLTKSGAGTLTLNAANTYGSAGLGQTNLTAGTLIAGNDSAFGTSLINVSATSAIEASATRALANNLQLNSATAFTLTLGGSSALAFNGNINQTGNSHTIDITNSALTTFGDASSDQLILAELDQARTLTLAVGAGGLTVNSTIVDGTGSGADSLIKSGSGTMTLNASSTYTGTTALQGGTTIASSGAANRLPATTALTIGSGANSAILQLGDGSGASDQTLTSLATTGSGTTNAIVGGGNATYSTLTVNQAGNTTFAGNIGGTGTNQNNLNVVKQGAGELIVSGSGAGAWTGTTTVNGGKLLIDSTSAFNAATTSLTVADGAEFSLRGTGLLANQVYGFGASAGNKITVGSGAGTALLGFRIDGGFNTQLQLLTGQTMTVTTGSIFQTAVYVDDAPTNLQQYILIDGADANSLDSGGGTFDFNPVVFNGGSFTYALTNETGGGTYDRWVLTPTAQAAAADVWWKGDLTGIGAGVWSASTTSGIGFPTNWDDGQNTGTDALVPPDSGSIVHFSATGAANFATTLGANLTIQELIFHSGATDISVGGANTLTIGNTVDAAGITLQAGAPTNVSFSANVALAQAQSFNIADSGDTLTFAGGLSGTGPLGINDNGSSNGTMVLAGASGLATYSGATNLVAGRLILQGGANNRLPTTTNLTMGNATLGAILQLGNATGASNTTIGTLATGAATTNSIVGGFTTASILTVVQGSAGTFNGVIGGAGTNENQVGITKQGTATLVLNGANTYTGATTVNNGVLQLGSTGSINGTTSLTVSAQAGVTAAFDVNGRTAVLGGGITLGGADATAQANITDTATGGLLTLGGALTYDATNNPLGSIIGVNLDAGAAARTITVNDSSTAATDLTFNGTLAQSGGNLTLAGAGNAAINGAWTLSGTDRAITYNSTGTWTINATTNTTGTGDWNINSGVINATVTNALNAADDIIIDGAGVQDSAIVNISGTAGTSGVHQGDGIFIRNGGRINVTVNNGISLGTNTLNIGDSASTGASGAGRLDLAANISTTGALQLGAAGNQIGNITGTGTITSASYSLRGGSIGSNVTLAGTGGITKVSDGTVTFSGDRTTSGATAIQEGNLILDYTTNTNSKIGGVLTLGAATANLTAPTALTMNANAAVTTQSVTSTTISNSGDVFVDINDAGAATTLALGAITRSVVGGTVSFDYSSASAVATTSNAAAGALGWATVTTGGTTRIGAISGGNIVQATTTTNNTVNTWGTLQNVINTAGYSGTLDPNCNTIASLTFDAAAASTVTIGTGSTLLITSGGILVNSGVGANSSTITGGSILGSTTAPLGELMIHQNNTAGLLTINSNIVNSSGITKSGLGTLVLGGDNTFLTGSRLTINEGTVQLNGGGAIGDSTIVMMRTGTTLDLNNSNETIGNLGVDGTNTSSGTIDLGSGTLTVNQVTTATFNGGIIGTGGLVKNGTGTLTIGGNNTFNGPVVINGGILDLQGSGGLMTSVSTFTLNAAELTSNQNDTTERDRIGSGADIILNNTAGTNGLRHITNQGNTKTENIGDIRIGAGHNVVTAHGNATNAIAVLQADTLTRLNTASQTRGTVLVRGNALGASSGTRGTIAFDSGAQATVNGFEVGGGGAATTQNISIIPWMIGDLSQTGLGNTFVTNVDATVGLRPLASSEYTTNAAGFDALTAATPSTNNVRFDTGATLTGTATAINSLVIDAATGQTVTGPANAIEITSGAILAASSGTTITHALGGFSAITTGGSRDYTTYVTSTTGTLTISSPLTSAVPLVKSGAGTLSLTNAGNLFTDVYLNQGAILIDDLDKVNGTTNTLHFAGGTLRLAAGFTDDPSTKPWNITTGGGSLDVSLVTAGVTLVNGIDDTTVSSSDTLNIFTRSAGTGSIGQLTIQGASTFTGTVIVRNSGTSTITDANGIVLNGTTNAAINGNLEIGDLVNVNNNFDAVVALGASDQIVDTATITFRGATGENAYFKLLGFNETVAGIIDTTANGVIENREGDIVTASGTLTLNSNSDYSYNGFMRDLSTGAADTNKLILVKQGTGTQTLSGANIRHSGTTTISGGGLTLTDVTNWQSAITNDATLNINQTTGSRNHTQVISGSGTVNKLGAGTIVIPTATTNTYSGLTDIQQGTLSISASANLGDASASNDIRIANGATLQSTGANVNLGVDRSVSLAGVGGTIEVTSTNTLTAPGGLIGDVCHTLTKTGSGLFVLTNITNGTTFTGATNVSAGILQVGSGGTAGSSGTGESGSGDVTVASGATLAGSGTVTGSTILGSGAVLQAGDVTSVGTASSTITGNSTLTFTAAVTANAGSEIRLSLTGSTNLTPDNLFGGNTIGTAGWDAYVIANGGTGAGDHDRLVLTDLAFSTSTAALTVVGNSFTPINGQIFNLLDWSGVLTGFTVGSNHRDGSADDADQFNLPNISSSGLLWDVSLFNTNGIVVVVPEPSRALLLMLGMLGLMLRRRRQTV